MLYGSLNNWVISEGGGALTHTLPTPLTFPTTDSRHVEHTSKKMALGSGANAWNCQKSIIYKQKLQPFTNFTFLAECSCTWRTWYTNSLQSTNCICQLSLVLIRIILSIVVSTSYFSINCHNTFCWHGVLARKWHTLLMWVLTLR